MGLETWRKSLIINYRLVKILLINIHVSEFSGNIYSSDNHLIDAEKNSLVTLLLEFYLFSYKSIIYHS